MSLLVASGGKRFCLSLMFVLSLVWPMGLVEKVVSMAFNLNVFLSGLEYRTKRYGVSASSGKAWMSLVFEDSEGYQVETSVPADLQQDILDMVDDGALARGDKCDCAVKAVARADGNSYIQLRAIPEVLEDEEC